MTSYSSYTPFLIGEGQSKTGLFTYLASWVKPEDAFDILNNAYVYRGVIFQRNGMVPFTSSAGNGGLVYADTSLVSTVAGGPVSSYDYSDTNSVTIPKLPIVSGQAGSLVIRTNTSAGVETWTDNGSGTLTGNLGDTGTINYSNGRWALTLSGGRTIATGIDIYATYAYVPTKITTGSNAYNPIMGIKEFNDPTTGVPITIVFDTKRASYFDRTSISFKPINKIRTYIWQGNGSATSSGARETRFTDLSPYSIVVTAGADTVTDDGVTPIGGLTASGNITGGSVDYALGQVTVNFTSAPASTVNVRVTATLDGDYFTGDNTKFFNTASWRYNAQVGSLLFATNNVNPVTTWDGTYLSRPLFNTVYADVTGYNYTNNVTLETCIDLKVYRNRLLFLRPKLLNATTNEPQTIRYSIFQTDQSAYSAEFSPWNLAADVAGNGGFINASAEDWIQGSAFIRDTLCVFFQRSTRLLRYSQSNADPFRFDRLNVSRQTDAPYSIVEYDQNAAAAGALGLIYCDGVNVNRYDISIIDYVEQISQTGFGQIYGFNNYPENQTWILYPTVDNDLDTSDAALIYNSLENTWAVYTFNLGNLTATPANINAMSVVGPTLGVKDLLWSDFADNGFFGADGMTWEAADFSWDSFLSQTLSPILMGGDQDGKVYQMDVGPTDNGNIIKTQITTKQLNPFKEQGLKCSYGYLDIYYLVNSSITVSVNFYQNNNFADPIVSRTMTLNGDSNATYAWKRVYINVTAEFLRIEIKNESPLNSDDYDGDGTFQILGMILHAAPAGRLTPGQFI